MVELPAFTAPVTMLREYLFAIGGGAGAAIVVATGMLLVMPKHAPAPEKKVRVTVVQQKPVSICRHPQLLEISGVKTCVYECAHGEKTQVKGVVSCIPEIEQR